MANKGKKKAVEPPHTDYKPQVGDLVGAKVKGYPFWPARVESIANNGKPVVIFFKTNDFGYNCELKPFSCMTESELASKKKNFQEAVQLCRQLLSKRSENGDHSMPDIDEPPSSDGLEIDIQDEPEHTACMTEPKKSLKPEKQLRRRKPPKRKSSLEQNHEMIDHDEVPMRQAEVKHERSRRRGTLSKDEDLSEQQVEKPQQEAPNRLESLAEPEPIDCSLNDLTSEQANADRGNTDTSLPETRPLDGVHETLAKLKRKIKIKLDEKAALKKAREEQKKYKKVSEILPKFSTSFKQLFETARRQLKDLEDKKNARHLKICMKTCETRANLLNKCLAILMTIDFGRSFEEIMQFHTLLVNTVTSVKKLKNKQNSLFSKDCKAFIKALRRYETIKRFINEFAGPVSSGSSPKEGAIVEAKENPRKRLKVIH